MIGIKIICGAIIGLALFFIIMSLSIIKDMILGLEDDLLASFIAVIVLIGLAVGCCYLARAEYNYNQERENERASIKYDITITKDDNIIKFEKCSNLKVDSEKIYFYTNEGDMISIEGYQKYTVSIKNVVKGEDNTNGSTTEQ